MACQGGRKGEDGKRSASVYWLDASKASGVHNLNQPLLRDSIARGTREEEVVRNSRCCTYPGRGAHFAAMGHLHQARTQVWRGFQLSCARLSHVISSRSPTRTSNIPL